MMFWLNSFAKDNSLDQKYSSIIVKPFFVFCDMGSLPKQYCNISLTIILTSVWYNLRK